MCIAARRGNDRSIGAVLVSRFLTMLHPAAGDLAPSNLEVAQHLIKGRAGRGFIRARGSVERHRFPPLQQLACSCCPFLRGSWNASLWGRFRVFWGSGRRHRAHRVGDRNAAKPSMADIRYTARAGHSRSAAAAPLAGRRNSGAAAARLRRPGIRRRQSLKSGHLVAQQGRRKCRPTLLHPTRRRQSGPPNARIRSSPTTTTLVAVHHGGRDLAPARLCGRGVSRRLHRSLIAAGRRTGQGQEARR